MVSCSPADAPPSKIPLDPSSVLEETVGRPSQDMFFGNSRPTVLVVAFDYPEVRQDFFDAIRFRWRNIDIVCSPGEFSALCASGGGGASKPGLHFQQDKVVQSSLLQLPSRA